MCTDSRYLKIWEEIVSPSYFTFNNSCFGFDPATKYGMYEMHETVCLCTSAVPYGISVHTVVLYCRYRTVHTILHCLYITPQSYE